MSWPNWNDMQLYQWLGIGGGAVALLALVLALALRKRGPVQVPAALGAALAAFAAGVGAGVVLLASFGYKWEKEPPPQVPGAAGGDPVMMQVNMAGRGGPGGRGRGGPDGGGGGAPSPKVQLASLVDKLDVLTAKPLAVELDGAKKKEVLEQLRGLAEKEELKDDEAKAKLDALLKVLEGDRDTLEAVGYRWPGAAAPGGGGRGPGPGGPAPAPPNPFKQGDNSKHLKDLQERLKKGTAG